MINMDPFTQLRLSSIFGPNQSAQASMMGSADPNADAGPQLPVAGPNNMTLPPPTSIDGQSIGGNESDMNPDVAAMMKQLYQPSTDASDNLKKILSSQPTPPTPSILRKLIAGGLGAIRDTQNTRMEPLGVRPTETGSEASDRFLGMPQYQQALTNWRSQLAGAQSAANTERESNANQRTAATQTINDILKQQSESERERHDMATEKAAEARAQIQQFAANNRDWQFTAPKGGNYTFINKLSGEKRDTGVPTGTLSQLDEMNLSASNAMARTEVTAGAKGQLGEMPDPSDPTGTKKMSVWITTDPQGNPIVKPVTMGGQQVNPNKTSSAAPVDNAQVQKQNQEIQDKTRESLAVIDELMDKNNKLKNTAGIGFAGIGPLNTRNIPGTQAYDNGVAINRLKGMLTLDLINQMRQASKTGSTGFGRITNQELNLLQNAAAQLDPGQDPKKFEQQLALIKEKLNEVLLPSDSSNPTSTAVPGSTKKPTASGKMTSEEKQRYDNLIKKYGGSGSNEE